MSSPIPRSSRPGLTWFVSVGFLGLGLLTLREARSSSFAHSEELAWVIAYAVSFGMAALSLALGVAHLLRRRLRNLWAWLPVVAASALLAWLIAYLFFDAFRAG